MAVSAPPVAIVAECCIYRVLRTRQHRHRWGGGWISWRISPSPSYWVVWGSSEVPCWGLGRQQPKINLAHISCHVPILMQGKSMCWWIAIAIKAQISLQQQYGAHSVSLVFVTNFCLERLKSRMWLIVIGQITELDVVGDGGGVSESRPPTAPVPPKNTTTRSALRAFQTFSI